MNAFTGEVKDWDHLIAFDIEFPEVDLKIPVPQAAANVNNNKGGGEQKDYKDWVFINYTFKRFEGLTQRGQQMAAVK